MTRPVFPDKPTILLVEDDEDLRVSLAEFLDDELPHLQVVDCADPLDALSKVTLFDVRVVVTDYQMPRMDGIEFLRRVRELAPEVPRIIMSAHVTLDVATRGVNEERIQFLLQKPLDLDEILRAVNTCAGEMEDKQQLASGFSAALSRPKF